ncbi:MAG: 50S ribosomal protein L18 [Alloprevotella sp.]
MTTKKEQRRIKIKYRVRNKITGTSARPRLTVFRSNKQIYAQIVDDSWENTEVTLVKKVRKDHKIVEIPYHPYGKTLVAASSLGMEAMPKCEQAAKVGEAIAKKAIEAGISEVVFDRNGYLYHGRVKEVADGARKGGLKF